VGERASACARFDRMAIEIRVFDVNGVRADLDRVGG
jgi:hypothetical protein